MPRWLKGLSVGVVAGLVGTALVLTPLGADFEKHVGLAWLFKLRGAMPPPPQAAVVAINERAASGLDLPSLPRDWPRSVHARLVDNLVARGAAVIVFDMDFQHSRSEIEDREFAAAIERAGRVVLFERLDGRRQPLLDGAGQPRGWVWQEELTPPVEVLAQAALGLGPFPVPKQQVNVFEFWAFKPSAGDIATMPAVALQLYGLDQYPGWLARLEATRIEGIAELPRERAALAGAADLRRTMVTLRRTLKANPLALDGYRDVHRPQGDTRAQSIAIALSALYHGADSRYLNFYGPPGTIKTVPYNAVITGTAPGVEPAALDFTDQVVFVGFSDLFDPGQPDRFYTVFTRSDGVDLSGAEIAATAFANLLTDRTLKPLDPRLTTIVLLLLGIALGATVYLLPALLGVPLALVLTGGYVVAAQLAFNTADRWLPLATPVLVQLPLALFIGLLGQYLLERRRQRRFSKAVSYYLPERIARELTEKELDPNSFDRVARGICLATDMSGFTTISEKLPPDQLAAYMNAYFDSLATTLKRYQVDVTEFHADTIMCAWTGSLSDDDAGQQAALAGLAVAETVRQFNRQRASDLYTRVGLAEGQFYLGHTGGGGRLGFSILGDCPNTAARLESLNKQLGTHILATRSVVARVENLLLRPLGEFILVGKAEPVSIVEIIATLDSATAEQHQICEKFAAALACFRERRWRDAEESFAALVDGQVRDGPASFYLERCRVYLSRSPSEELATVIHMSTK